MSKGICIHRRPISKKQSRNGFFRCNERKINIHISDCEKCEMFSSIFNRVDFKAIIEGKLKKRWQ